MTRDRVVYYLVGLTVANALILTWALWSSVVAALGLAVIGWAWGMAAWAAYRSVAGDLYQAQLRLATITPEQWQEAQQRQASDQEIARVAGIVQRQGYHFPQDDAQTRGPRIDFVVPQHWRDQQAEMGDWRGDRG